ncbi:hypothetical protein [Streptomyces sp. KR55]|uniref:hypothetical protein n=1 Tax=Streptomyces sp. KR55 TaxID=3457425 RepID=UPI003FD3383B
MPPEECPYQDGRVVIDPAFKADAPARYARLRELGPIHPAEFHLGLKGWVIVGYDLAREALAHPPYSRTPRPPPRPWPPPATSSTSPRWGSARR